MPSRLRRARDSPEAKRGLNRMATATELYHDLKTGRINPFMSPDEIKKFQSQSADLIALSNTLLESMQQPSTQQQQERARSKKKKLVTTATATAIATADVLSTLANLLKQKQSVTLNFYIRLGMALHTAHKTSGLSR